MHDSIVHSREVDGHRVLSVQGELDVATAPDLDAAGRSALAAGLPVVVDLSGCTFLDSSGCRAVGMVGRAGSAAGLAACVVSPPQVTMVRRVVDHVGLHVLMPVHDSLAVALVAEHREQA